MGGQAPPQTLSSLWNQHLPAKEKKAAILPHGVGVQLSGESAPAKVAKENQYKNDDDDDPKNRHVILSLGGRLYSPSAHPLLFAGGLGGGDQRNAKSENESGDSEPYRSPKTKLRGARRRFATASPYEEEPLGAALNPPFTWCPNDTKCRPRQREATGDQERSADYHTSKLTDKLGEPRRVVSRVRPPRPADPQPAPALPPEPRR